MISRDAFDFMRFLWCDDLSFDMFCCFLFTIISSATDLRYQAYATKIHVVQAEYC